MISDFGHYISFGNKENLSRYSYCFEQDSFGLADYRAVSEHGKRKLKEDRPEIWEEFELDGDSA